jgi:hypothetical protein
MEIIRRPRTRTGTRIATKVIEMKVALVTGASSGIGEVVAQRLTAKRYGASQANWTCASSTSTSM